MDSDIEVKLHSSADPNAFLANVEDVQYVKTCL